MRAAPALDSRAARAVILGFAAAAALAACSEPSPGSPDASASDAPPAIDGPPAGAPLLEERFAVDGAWPAGWRVLGGVSSAQVVGGRGSLVPVVSSYSLARMGHDLGAADVEVTFTLQLADLAAQGVGFYVRQNGGYLTQTGPVGAGYAVFVEGFRGAAIGLWRERAGAEELLSTTVPTTLANNTRYAVRFRCAQAGAMTALAAKIWPASGAEPAAWTIERTDATPALQGVTGGIAVDAWNTATPGQGAPPAPISVDDIVVVRAP